MLILQSIIICGCFGMMLPSTSSATSAKNNTSNYDDHNPMINWSERISFGDKRAVYRLSPTSWTNDLNDLIQYLIDNELHQPLLIELPNRVEIVLGENRSDNNLVAENHLDNRPLNRECTIIVTVVASVCLLLFSALTLSLIIIKKKCSSTDATKEKLGSLRSAQPEHLSPNSGIDTRGVLPQRFPRKSSLKKPSNEFPVQDCSDQASVTIDEHHETKDGQDIIDGAKRKSIVKFDEKTLKK